MENLSLKWNSFPLNLATSVKDLRKEASFCDVTLVSDDEVFVNAHRIVLSSASNFFQGILRKSTHSSPLIYLAGIDSSILNFIVDFMYVGEIQLLNDDVEKFLKTAKLLKIEGLGAFRNDYEIIQEGDFKIEELDSKESVSLDSLNVEDEEDESGGGNEEFHLEEQLNVPKEDGQLMDTAKLCDEDINEKNQDIKSLKHQAPRKGYKTGYLTLDSISKAAIDKLIDYEGELWICKMCGRTAKQVGQIRQHAEIHMTNLSFPCQECDESFSTRKKLAYHMQKIHLGGWYYSCNECLTNYGSQEKLRKHCNKKHGGY